MTLQIRRIHPDEYALVGDLVVDSYAYDGFLDNTDGSPEHSYATVLRDAAQRDAKAELWLAVDAEQILGCVTWCPVGSPYRELATGDQQGEFRALAVAPTARGRGAGRALVQYCLQRARADALAEVVICSMPQMTTAHRLYESCGFTRRPELDWSPVAGVTLWAYAVDLANSAQVVHTVTDRDTAIALGSGSLPVLATPRLLAWCEEASCAALALGPGRTSVGTRIDLEHRAASAIGTTVTATATIVARTERQVDFQVLAHDATGRLLARGRVRRAVVDSARFMARISDVGD